MRGAWAVRTNSGPKRQLVLIRLSLVLSHRGSAERRQNGFQNGDIQHSTEFIFSLLTLHYTSCVSLHFNPLRITVSVSFNLLFTPFETQTNLFSFNLPVSPHTS